MAVWHSFTSLLRWWWKTAVGYQHAYWILFFCVHKKKEEVQRWYFCSGCRNAPMIRACSAHPSVSRSTVCAHTTLATPVFRRVRHNEQSCEACSAMCYQRGSCARCRQATKAKVESSTALEGSGAVAVEDSPWKPTRRQCLEKAIEKLGEGLFFCPFLFFV